ncbi:MAG: polyprenyl synthetase family protein [Acidimicrobiales bacterium]
MVVNVAELFDLPEMAGDLAALEDALMASVVSEDAFLSEVAGHLIVAGGKRLRPALTLASAAAGGAGTSAGIVQGGVSVELVHLGSLYHDDVMDEGTSRRGVQTVNARWGNLVAILAGDFLLAKASEIAASLGTEVAGLLARTIGRLCQGQVGELRTAFSPSRSRADYMAAIAGKTASLMAASCRVGALCAGLPRPAVDALTEFGQAFGMVFQIRDDVLDVVGTDESLGKTAGQDLVQGIYTLPVILALADPDAGPELQALLGVPLDAPERDKARDIVRASPAIAASAAVARGYAEQAAAALDRPELVGPVAGSLRDLAHRLLEDVTVS